MKAAEVADALHRRYGARSQGRDAEQFICIEEARSGAGFDGGGARCDFLAINTWPSRGLEIIGHEIKVSKADWQSELANPGKADAFAQFCRRWWVVMPSELATKIRHDVPETWGLLSISDNGRATELTSAPVRPIVKEVPKSWWVGWMSGIDRTHKRVFPTKLAEAMNDERSKFELRIEMEAAKRADVNLRRLETLENGARRLKEITGIDLSYEGEWALERFAKVWSVAKRSHLGDFRSVADGLRRTAEQLELLEELHQEPVD